MAWARVAQQRCGMALGMVLLLDFGSGVGSPLSFQALILYWAVGVVLFSYGVNLRGAFGSSARWASSWTDALATGEGLAYFRLDILLHRHLLHRNGGHSSESIALRNRRLHPSSSFRSATGT